MSGELTKRQRAVLRILERQSSLGEPAPIDGESTLKTFLRKNGKRAWRNAGAGLYSLLGSKRLSLPSSKQSGRWRHG
jgi:hypothetical protein